MSDQDKQEFAQSRPLIVGALAALVYLCRPGLEAKEAFDMAEGLAQEFERRNS